MLLSSGDNFPHLIQKRRSQLGFVTYLLNCPRILAKSLIISFQYNIEIVYLFYSDPILLYKLRIFSEILLKIHKNKSKTFALHFYLKYNIFVWFLIRYWRLYWMKSHFPPEVRNFISIVWKWLMLFGLISS